MVTTGGLFILVCTSNSTTELSPNTASIPANNAVIGEFQLMQTSFEA